MKPKLTKTLSLLTAVLLLSGCASTAAVTDEGATEIPEAEGFTEIEESAEESVESAEESETLETGNVLFDESGADYSANTLILLLDPSASDEDADALCEKYGLAIKYRYSILSGIAVMTEHTMTAEELDALIASLEAEEIVTSAERDYIAHIDGDSMGTADFAADIGDVR